MAVGGSNVAGRDGQCAASCPTTRSGSRVGGLQIDRWESPPVHSHWRAVRLRSVVIFSVDQSEALPGYRRTQAHSATLTVCFTCLWSPMTCRLCRSAAAAGTSPRAPLCTRSSASQSTTITTVCSSCAHPARPSGMAAGPQRPLTRHRCNGSLGAADRGRRRPRGEAGVLPQRVDRAGQGMAPTGAAAAMMASPAPRPLWRCAARRAVADSPYGGASAWRASACLLCPSPRGQTQWGQRNGQPRRRRVDVAGRGVWGEERPGATTAVDGSTAAAPKRDAAEAPAWSASSCRATVATAVAAALPRPWYW